MDYVIRKKYHGDVLFEVKKIINDVAIIRGVYVRLVATAPLDDLIYIDKKELKYYQNQFKKRHTNLFTKVNMVHNHLTGKILHIDSDYEYLKKCNEVYENLNLYAICVLLQSDEIERHIMNLVKEYNVDIVVLTGHDSYNNEGINDIKNYTSTSGFYNSVRLLRKEYSKDELYIFAGACQSNFEALIAAGANSASSPKRVNIDALDPLVVAVKASTTPFNKIISFESIWSFSLSGHDGISGIDSYGKMRILR